MCDGLVKLQVVESDWVIVVLSSFELGHQEPGNWIRLTLYAEESEWKRLGWEAIGSPE